MEIFLIRLFGSRLALLAVIWWAIHFKAKNPERKGMVCIQNKRPKKKVLPHSLFSPPQLPYSRPDRGDFLSPSPPPQKREKKPGSPFSSAFHAWGKRDTTRKRAPYGFTINTVLSTRNEKKKIIILKCFFVKGKEPITILINPSWFHGFYFKIGKLLHICTF